MSLDLVALVIANMVGVGVFTTSGLALQSVPDPWVLMALWALGGVYAVVGAIAYGGLARAHPDNGGEHHLLRSLGRPAWGFAAGVVSLTAGFAGPLAAAAHGLDAYLGTGTGAVALLGFGALHASRAGLGLRLQTTAVLAKLALVALVVGLAALRAGPELPVSGAEVAPSAMFAVFVWITFSYTGFNAAVYLAGEHPPSTVARAGVVGALGVTVLYLLLNAAFVLAQPVAETIGRADVAVAAAANDGGSAVLATQILAGTALVTSVSSLAVAGGRVVQSMARAGDLGSALARLGERPGPGVAAISLLAGAAYGVAGLPEILGVAGWMLAGSSTLVVGAGLWHGVYPDA
ncbi:MAG: amino acid permease, partial [Myxococcota bacterium]